MADRQVGISVKATVNDRQLMSLKDTFRGVTRGMGNDMDELSARTQKYLENLRRAQEVGATPAYRQQLRQQQLELKQSIDARLRGIKREGDEAVAQINRQILATKRFVYDRQQLLKQSGIGDDERGRLRQEIAQQQAELRRLQLEKQQVLQAQREQMIPAGQLREQVQATGSTLRELPTAMFAGAGAKLGGLLKTGAALFGLGSIAQQVAQGIQGAIATQTELGDLAKRVKDANETYREFQLRVLQVGDALGYTNEEMRQLSQQAAALVGARAFQTTMETAAGFARAYGLQAPFVTQVLGQMFQAGVTGGVTAQMRPQDFVAMLAEAIESGRMAGREEELIRSIEDLVAATQRTLVTPPNLQAMFEVLTTLNQSGIQGLTGERGAQLLNQLSQGIMQPGGGEAGELAMFQALNAGGVGLDYYKYRLLQEQGAFGTIEELNKLIPNLFTPEEVERFGKRTNLEAIMEWLASGRLPLPVEAERASNLLGISRTQYLALRGVLMENGQFQTERLGAIRKLLGGRDITEFAPKLGQGGWRTGRKAIEMGKSAAPWLQRGMEAMKEGAGRAAGAAEKAAEAAGKGAKAAAPWLSRISGIVGPILGELAPWLGVEATRRSDLEMAVSVREKLANGTPLTDEEQICWARVEQNLKIYYKTNDSLEALDQYIVYLSGMGITNWGIKMSPELQKKSEEINRQQQEESRAYARKWWQDRWQGIKRFFGFGVSTSGSYELQGDLLSARQQAGMIMPASWSAGNISMPGGFSLLPYYPAMQAPIMNVPWYGGFPPQIMTLPYFFNQVPGSGITLASLSPGQAVRPGGLFGSDIMPVEGTITSPFGMRIDPFTKEMRFHEGVDIAAPEGTPVRSTTMGIVSKVIADARAGGAAGKYIEITTPDGRTVRSCI